MFVREVGVCLVLGMFVRVPVSELNVGQRCVSKRTQCCGAARCRNNS